MFIFVSTFRQFYLRNFLETAGYRTIQFFFIQKPYVSSSIHDADDKLRDSIFSFIRHCGQNRTHLSVVHVHYETETFDSQI